MCVKADLESDRNSSLSAGILLLWQGAAGGGEVWRVGESLAAQPDE